MRYTKINTLVLQGPTNAGKSLIADTLVGICKPEEVSRERDNSGFHFDQLPEASAVIFEEPCITPVNVGTWKLLFEGKHIKTDIKRKDKEGIRRLPIWVTSATKITANIDTCEACQVNQRLKIFEFLHSIQHRTETYTQTYCKTNRTLKKPQGYVKAAHFAYLYLLLWDKIRTLILQLDDNHTINPERLKSDTWKTRSNLAPHTGYVYEAATNWSNAINKIEEERCQNLQRKNPNEWEWSQKDQDSQEAEGEQSKETSKKDTEQTSSQ